MSGSVRGGLQALIPLIYRALAALGIQSLRFCSLKFKAYAAGFFCPRPTGLWSYPSRPDSSLAAHFQRLGEALPSTGSWGFGRDFDQPRRLVPPSGRIEFTLLIVDDALLRTGSSPPAAPTPCRHDAVAFGLTGTLTRLCKRPRRRTSAEFHSA